jgi:aspartokinase
LVSIARVVKEVIEEDIAMQDAIARDYANLSGIARIIKGEVEKRLGSKVNYEAIVTALRRIKIEEKKGISEGVRKVVADSTIDVRTDVAKLSLEKNRSAEQKTRKVLAMFPEGFIQFSESASAITLIYDQRIRDKILPSFNENDILEDEVNLAAIVVRSPKEIARTPGCISAFFSELARRRINVEDTTSCYTDTIMVVKMEDAAKAFNALTELISRMRKVK